MKRKVVVGNQITPIPVTLDGKEHTVELPLEVIAQDLDTTDGLTLQIVATTTAYATPPLGGTLDATSVTLTLPIAKDGSVTRR